MAGDDGAGGPLPPTLREILAGAHRRRCPRRAQTVVGVAAVAGRRIDHDLLAAVAGMAERRRCSTALRDGGRQPGPRHGHGRRAARDGDYAFRHALLQEAAYDDLLPGRAPRAPPGLRRGPRRRDGPGSGASAAGHWAELAYHWSAARDDRHAFDASLRAATPRPRAFAFADARRHDERALELWTARRRTPRTWPGSTGSSSSTGAAVAAWLAGDGRRAVALRREAIAASSPDADPIRAAVMRSVSAARCGSTASRRRRSRRTSGRSRSCPPSRRPPSWRGCSPATARS